MISLFSLRTTMGPRQSEPPPDADLTNDTDLAHKPQRPHHHPRPHHPNRSQQPPGPAHAYHYSVCPSKGGYNLIVPLLVVPLVVQAASSRAHEDTPESSTPQRGGGHLAHTKACSRPPPARYARSRLGHAMPPRPHIRAPLPSPTIAQQAGRPKHLRAACCTQNSAQGGGGRALRVAVARP